MELPRRDGGPYPEMENVNYIQNGSQNRQYNNNNYRPNQGDNNYNNYSGNRSHPNLSYANNNYLQTPAGFSVTNGAINEPKKESIEDVFRNFIKRTESSQKVTDNKVGLLEGALATLTESMSGVNTHMSMIETQLSQLNNTVQEQDRRKREEQLKAMENLDDINKKWAEETQCFAESKVSGPLTGASTSGTASGSKSEMERKLSGPLNTPQRSAESDTRPDQIVRNYRIPLSFSPKRKQSLMSILNVF